MVKRNPNIAILEAGYLFPEINKRKREFLHKNPEVELISLGIGDTTEPIPQSISEALIHAAQSLGTHEGYKGYGPEQGYESLRKEIAEKIYSNIIHSCEVFISDGAKCDIGRLQLLFGNQVSVAIQNPSYPVYVDGSIIQGVKNIVFMPCSPANDFFPDLDMLPRTDLIYFCSPNNPTGATASHSQLQKLVDFAKANRSIIIFDAAYANFITDDTLPKSIYEIDGARDVAIETSSFSKLAGFTGVRLGWTVVPENLAFEDGGSVKGDWFRLISTIFNGASNISQQGGFATLQRQGIEEIKLLTNYYLENAKYIKTAFEEKGYEVFGGIHAPYVWVRFPRKNAWNVFQELLEKYHIVSTPGSGFGSEGNEFVRFSAFSHRANVYKAIERLKKLEILNSLVN